MNQQQMYNDQYEDISLRELIDVLLEGKRIIAGVTLVALVVTFIISFFAIKPTYEATVVLLTSDVQVGKTSLENINNVIDSYNQYPSMTVKTYLEQVKSPQVLQRAIDSLELKTDKGQKITVQSLANMVEVNNTKDTNLITVMVTHKDAEKAAVIANTVGESFIRFITDNIRGRSKAAANLIEEQLAVEEKNIAEATYRLTQYLKDSGNLNEMKKEMDAIISQITSFKSQLNNVQNSIIIEKETIQVLRGSGVKSTVNLKDINLDLSSSDGSGSFKVAIDKSNQVEGTVLAMKLANVETSLISNISKEKVLEGKVEELMSELITLQTKIAEEEYTYNSIQRDLSLANQAYNAYKQRHKEAILTAATDLGSTSVVVSSSAIVPNSPVNPKRSMNMLIGVVLGFMLGTMITFFNHYWAITNNKKENKVKMHDENYL